MRTKLLCAVVAVVAIVGVAIVLAIKTKTPKSEASVESAFPDSADLVKVSEFSLDGYSTEGTRAKLYINAKTKDSILTVTYYFETGRAESKFLFNKKLIDAESIDNYYDMQKAYELHEYGVVASTKKTNMNSSEEAAERLTTAFLRIRETISENPSTRQGFAYLDKGDSELVTSYYDSAVDAFNRAIWLDDENGDAYLGRGRAYLRKGDNTRAIADFNEAIRWNWGGQRAIAFSNRGRAYARMGDYDKAVADFEEAAEIDPNNELIKQNLERAKRREKGL